MAQAIDVLYTQSESHEWEDSNHMQMLDVELRVFFQACTAELYNASIPDEDNQPEDGEQGDAINHLDPFHVRVAEPSLLMERTDWLSCREYNWSPSSIIPTILQSTGHVVTQSIKNHSYATSCTPLHYYPVKRHDAHGLIRAMPANLETSQV